MGDVYHEWLIKRRRTIIDILIRILFILLTLTTFFLSFFGTLSRVIFFILAIAFAYLTRYMFQRTDVEYEYSFLSGELQIDRICGKARRKACYKIEMNKVEAVAKEGSPELEQFERQNYKYKDYSSLEDTDRRYVVFERKDKELVKIIFEPNEEIVNDMKTFAPRKVFE
ncbi:MAG: hypothetical protein IIT48_06350 [Lachnospiraceae bacterium]|nr:hypothetical protein [Lachnospiraceae bacterium]